MFTVTKTYGHERGLSAAFRQWRAESHCAQIHGYALAFTFTFGAESLDRNGWVIDFGSLKPVKEWLEEQFDHKLLVACDDPHMDQLLSLRLLKAANPVLVDRTGCEAFAQMAFNWVHEWLMRNTNRRVTLLSVECREHGSNAAAYHHKKI